MTVPSVLKIMPLSPLRSGAPTHVQWMRLYNCGMVFVYAASFEARDSTFSPHDRMAHDFFTAFIEHDVIPDSAYIPMLNRLHI